jgi:hypothetical protein
VILPAPTGIVGCLMNEEVVATTTKIARRGGSRPTGGGQSSNHQEAIMAKRDNKPKLHPVSNKSDKANPDSPTIPKPSGFSLDKFKSKKAAAIANVETLLGALPHHPISQAKDFTKLHPDENSYWSPELCFVNVPIQGMKRDTLHLIDEDLGLAYLGNGKLLRFRLALATKPFDIFFLCHVPSQNLDNSWNVSVLSACEQAKRQWVQVTSRKAEGVESYKTDYAHDEDAFPEPKWPRQTLEELINVTFTGRMIEHEDHPALKRLIGAKQSVS